MPHWPSTPVWTYKQYLDVRLCMEIHNPRFQCITGSGSGLSASATYLCGETGPPASVHLRRVGSEKSSDFQGQEFWPWSLKHPKPVAHPHSTKRVTLQSCHSNRAPVRADPFLHQNLITSQFVQILLLPYFKYFDQKAQTIYHKIGCHQVELWLNQTIKTT